MNSNKNLGNIDNQKTDIKNMTQLINRFQKSSDFKTNTISLSHQKIFISYFITLIDEKKLQHYLIQTLQQSSHENPIKSIEEVLTMIPINEIEITDCLEVIHKKLLKGCVIIRLNEQDQKCALVHIPNQIGFRNSNNTENEFSVVGPKIGFIEDLDTNIHLLRLQINTPNLVVKEITIGSESNTRIAIFYIDGITNQQIVSRVEQRLQDIDFDVVFDSSQLDQIIADNSNTPFPLFLSTERRDRVVYALISGQVAFISDGSPYFVTGPSTLFDFFISPEDYYLPWILGSFFRLIRFFGVIFSLFASALYVGIMTYHYEIVPHSLLGPLIFSRINVPFPPILEVLFLEFTIEFLREAGARLPTKIGQTLGIVGGIIIGEAAVEAALTSNILIIIVSLSALASFATPIYKMSNTIRFLRFPIILLASIWGGLGIWIGVSFLLVHITRLKSLGYPYTVPLFPFRAAEFKDSFLRLPYQIINTRPGYLRPNFLLKYKPKDVRHNKKEWDEN